MVNACETTTISPIVEPTANSAVMTGSPAAMTVPNMKTRMTSAAMMPAPSAAPPSPSARALAASPPSSTRSPSPSASCAVSRIRSVSGTGICSDGVSSTTVA